MPAQGYAPSALITEPKSTAPTTSVSYIVTGTRWGFDNTGPAAAYWVLNGARYEVDSGASEHDAYFRLLGGRHVIR